jgi:hypothetical protein
VTGTDAAKPLAGAPFDNSAVAAACGNIAPDIAAKVSNSCEIFIVVMPSAGEQSAAKAPPSSLLCDCRDLAMKPVV